MRDDEAWKWWIETGYDPTESRGSVSDVLWARVQAASAAAEKASREMEALSA